MKAARKGNLVIDAQRCKGCGLCVWACPTGHIRLSNTADIRGITVACTDDSHGCTACGFCFTVCPDVAIEVYKTAAGRTRSCTS